MREIKFRAWDVDEEEWYNNEKIPYQLIDNEGVFYWADDYEWNRYPGEVLIMQYTGLKDKNGTEIYEYNEIDGAYEVIFQDLKYILRHISNDVIIDLYDYWRGKNGEIEVTREYTKV